MVKITSLTLSGRAAYQSTPKAAAHELLCLATLQATENTEEGTRAPVDIVCVLDHSGSMQGEKLALCLSTLDFLIQNVLSPNDRFGLVIFDTDVRVVFPPLLMDQKNKEMARLRVSQISAGSSTNLSGGLFAGLEQMLAAGSAQVSALLCLTDGLMNHGVTDRGRLLTLLMNQINAFPEKRTKPAIYAFGYGADCDTDCLSSIATQTGGSYYSILNLDSVGLAFADVLGGVLATTCQSIKLTMEIPPHCTFVGPALTQYPQECSSVNTIKVEIKDMFAGERRDILFKVMVPNGKEATILSWSVKYIDVVLAHSVEDRRELVVSRSEGSEVTGLMDIEVAKQFARFTAVEMMDESREHARRGSFDHGRRVVHAALLQTQGLLTRVNQDDEMLNEVCADLANAELNMASEERWRSVGLSKTTEAISGHSKQRNNKVSELSESSRLVESSDLMTPKAGVYQTTSAMRMMEAASNFFKKPV